MNITFFYPVDVNMLSIQLIFNFVIGTCNIIGDLMCF